MKNTTRSLIITLSFALACCSTNHKTEKQLPIVEQDFTIDDEPEPCLFINDQKQQDTYPFNKSYKIEIISYDTRHDHRTDLIDNGKFTVNNIKQRITLDKNQRDSLFSILFNLKLSPTAQESGQADCYNPRHAIVFHDNTNAIAFLEICFECQRTLQSPKVSFGQMCPEKWCILQRFIKSTGADFGIMDKFCEGEEN